MLWCTNTEVRIIEGLSHFLEQARKAHDDSRSSTIDRSLVRLSLGHGLGMFEARQSVQSREREQRGYDRR